MCTSTSVSRRSIIGARWFVAGFLGLTALTAGTTILVLGLAIAEHARSDERAPADAILVLGAAQYNGWPTRAFRARLDHAAALFRQGYAPTIVLVGGKTDRDLESEAEAGARYLREQGIPDTALIVVPVGRNTWQSIEAAAQPLHERGVQRLLVVSDGFHLFRSKLMARSFGFQVVGSPAPGSPIRPGSPLERWYIAREAVATLAFLLGRR